MVEPGLPRLRLWGDALTAMGREERDFPLSFASHSQRRKFDVALDRVVGDQKAVECIFLLAEGDELHFRPLEGVEAIDALMSNIYRGRFIDHSRSHVRTFETCVRILASVPVVEVRRRRSLDHFGEAASGILRWIEGGGPGAAR